MSICTDIDSCLSADPVVRQTQKKDIDDIMHTLNINTYIVVGNINIPIRKRVRSFTLNSRAGIKKNDYFAVMDLQLYEHACYTPESLYFLSVSEDSTWTDGTVYILDTEHNNAFWKETVYKCTFYGSSSETTSFITPTGTASKLRINDVSYQITTTWKLMINGEIEILHTETGTQSIYSQGHPLFFVHPPPFTGETDDIDFKSVDEGGHGYSFLDYRTGGYGPSEAEIRSGGRDYYYPEYLWYMGDYREQDQFDANERFWDTYGSITNLKEQEERSAGTISIHGPEDPRGSIVTDYAGNTFASVMVTKGNGTKLWFNRLNGVDPNLKIIDESIVFNGQQVTSGGQSVGFSEVIRSYFPIGLMETQNG